MFLTIISFLDIEAGEQSKPVKCTNITASMPPNTLILNQADAYDEEEKVLFSCSRGFYPTGPNVVMSSVCLNGSLVNDVSNGDCLKGILYFPKQERVHLAPTLKWRVLEKLRIHSHLTYT